MANQGIVIEQKVLDDLLNEINGEITARLRNDKAELIKAIQENDPGEQSEGSKSGSPMESLSSDSSGSSSSPSSSSDSSSSDSSDSSSSDSSSSSSDSSDSSSSDSSSSDSSDSSDSSSSDSSDSSSSDSSSGSGSSDSSHSMSDMSMSDPASDSSNSEMDLKSEYAKLDPDSLKAHYQACKEALMDVMGSEDSSSSSDGHQMMEGSPAPAMKAEDCADMSAKDEKSKSMEKMAYSEESKEKDKDKDEKSMEMMSKKEAEEKIAALETKIKEQADNFEKLTAALLKPMRKSIVHESEVADESAPSMTKSEVEAKLRLVQRNPLMKKDRELINDYWMGHATVSEIKHLLG